MSDFTDDGWAERLRIFRKNIKASDVALRSFDDDIVTAIIDAYQGLS